DAGASEARSILSHASPTSMRRSQRRLESADTYAECHATTARLTSPRESALSTSDIDAVNSGLVGGLTACVTRTPDPCSVTAIAPITITATSMQSPSRNAAVWPRRVVIIASSPKNLVEVFTPGADGGN